jgi:hypothetical protein
MSTFGTEYCYFLALVLIRKSHVADFEIELVFEVFEVFDAKKKMWIGLAIQPSTIDGHSVRFQGSFAEMLRPVFGLISQRLGSARFTGASRILFLRERRRD